MKWQLVFKTEVAKLSDADKRELKRAIFCDEIHETLKEVGTANAEAEAMYLALKVFELEESLGHPLMFQEISSALDAILKRGVTVDDLLTTPLKEFRELLLSEAFSSFAAAEESSGESTLASAFL